MNVVRPVRVELTPSREDRILSPARLPISPRALKNLHKFDTYPDIEYRNILTYNIDMQPDALAPKGNLPTDGSAILRKNCQEITSSLTEDAETARDIDTIPPQSAVTVRLSKGYVALVDLADLPLVSQYRWHVVHKPYPYAKSSHRGVVTMMHRLLAGAQPGQHVDHRNGDTLDNRRANLRTCTHADNMRNRRPHKGHRFKGITPNPSPIGGWVSQIMVNRKTTRIGVFPTEEEAARAYDAAARKHFGQFARLNFTEG